MRYRNHIFSSNVLLLTNLLIFACHSSFVMALGDDIEEEVMHLVKVALENNHGQGVLTKLEPKMVEILEKTCQSAGEKSQINGLLKEVVELKEKICEKKRIEWLKGFLGDSGEFLEKFGAVLGQFFSKSKMGKLLKIVKEIEKKSMKEMGENGKKKFDEEEQRIGAILRKITREIAGERGEKLASARGKEIFDWVMGMDDGLMPSVLFGRLQQLWHILKPAKVKGVRKNVVGVAGSSNNPIHRKMIQVFRRKKRQDDFGMMVIIVLACMFVLFFGMPVLVGIVGAIAKIMAGLMQAGIWIIGLFILFCFLFYGGGGGR